MGRAAKIKKWKSKTREYAERAEAAAARAEAAAREAWEAASAEPERGDEPGIPRPRVYTGARGAGDTAAVAEPTQVEGEHLDPPRS